MTCEKIKSVTFEHFCKAFRHLVIEPKGDSVEVTLWPLGTPKTVRLRAEEALGLARALETAGVRVMKGPVKPFTVAQECDQVSVEAHDGAVALTLTPQGEAPSVTKFAATIAYSMASTLMQVATQVQQEERKNDEASNDGPDHHT